MLDTLIQTRAIKDLARELGFDACGIAAVDPRKPIDPDDALGEWLRRGYHADMDWMAATKALRQDVREKLPGARAVVVVARNYYHEAPPAGPHEGKIARYAWGRDYHKYFRKPLRRIADELKAMDPAAESYCSTDSGPVMERSWAARAGIGWIGKNSLVLRRDIGSWFLLGTVITTVSLEPDAPVADHCGSCRACIDACPTDAIVEEGVVDAGRCISYQTIENRHEIPEEIAQELSGWVFGCDICQEVCPWNRFAQETDEPDFAPREGMRTPHLDELAALEEAAWKARYEGTPVRRAKYDGFQRNVRLVRAAKKGDR